MASRTKNATRNMMASLVNKLVRTIFPFIVRAVIIQVLGAEFLGLSSLFTAILQVLNLAELGFSSAVVYNMYKPIAEKDTETICALMNLYKKVYRVVGVIILVFGLAVMPFLPDLIKGNVPESINIYILYSIYLFNTVSTYFLFAYKSALVDAHQRNDIISNMYTITSILQYVIQIIVLFITKSFYLYVIVQCITSILNNVLVAIIAKKKYPEYICAGEATKELKKDIRKKVTGLVIQRVCVTTRNSLDSVFISAMIGLTAVAMYANYYTIMAAIVSVMGIITNSITAGVGNSVATESMDKNHKDLNKFNFIYMWLAGWLTVSLACLYQPLMELWMGSEYMFPYEIVILFCIYFYVLKMGDIRSVYVAACGLWYENRFRAILEAVANVVLNLVLGYFFGVAGIIAGTLISLFLINFGYGSTIIFKYYFKGKKVSEYFGRHLVMAAITVLVCFVTYKACEFVNFDGVAGVIVKGIICLILPNLLYLLVYARTHTFKDASKLVKKIIKRSF